MIRTLLTALTLLAAALQAPAQDKDKAPPPQKKNPAPVQTEPPFFAKYNGLPIVFVANGSGGSTSISEALRETAKDKRIALPVITIVWCRHNTSILDHADQEAHFAGAAKLAELTVLARKEAPDSPLHFVGASSGTRVVLAAAEMLPEKTLQRIYLLAPSVSCRYDLRLALRSSKCGIESFWSQWDNVLDLAAEQLGTADGQKTQCAGLVSFSVPTNVKGSGYENLLQVRWEQGMGGQGGHFTWASERFMHHYLVPSLFR